MVWYEEWRIDAPRRSHLRRLSIVTMDRNLPDQQNIPALSFGVIVVYAHSNRLTDLRPIVPELLVAIPTTAPGSSVRVGV